MTRMQEWLGHAAELLGVRVEIGYLVSLSDGRKLVSQALFPDLGGAFGTLVFCSQDTFDSSARRDLIAQGYGISMFSEPLPEEVFDIDSYAEMFADWGWCGDEMLKPEWMSCAQ